MSELIAGWSREEVHYVAERGYLLYREGRLREAAILFEGLTVIDPGNAYCRKALAAINISLGQYRVAARHFSMILGRDRLDVDALAGRCEALRGAGDLVAARRDLDSLLALPAGADHARRLRLQFQSDSEFARGARNASQLPPHPSR